MYGFGKDNDGPIPVWLLAAGTEEELRAVELTPIAGESDEDELLAKVITHLNQASVALDKWRDKHGTSHS